MMRCAAVAMVCRPDEQKRLMVMPDTVTGQPARKAAWRAMLAPVAPSGVAQPMMTSSTSPASMPARLMACSTAWPPSVAPWVMLKEPFQLLARGVRAVETITAEVMLDSSSSKKWGFRAARPWRLRSAVGGRNGSRRRSFCWPGVHWCHGNVSGLPSWRVSART